MLFEQHQRYRFVSYVFNDLNIIAGSAFRFFDQRSTLPPSAMLLDPVEMDHSYASLGDTPTHSQQPQQPQQQHRDAHLLDDDEFLDDIDSVMGEHGDDDDDTSSSAGLEVNSEPWTTRSSSSGNRIASSIHSMATTAREDNSNNSQLAGSSEWSGSTSAMSSAAPARLTRPLWSTGRADVAAVESDDHVSATWLALQLPIPIANSTSTSNCKFHSQLSPVFFIFISFTLRCSFIHSLIYEYYERKIPKVAVNFNHRKHRSCRAVDL